MNDKKIEPGATTRTPLNKCLDCGCKISAASTPDGRAGPPPTEGDLTVCIKCGAVMMLDRDLKVRGMTDAEIEELTSNRATMDELARMVRCIHLIRHRAN